MKTVRRILAFGLFAAITSMFSLTLVAQTGDIPSLQQTLNSQFRLTTTTADGSDIVTAGDVVTIHKRNLMMFAGTAVPATNNYVRGAIGQGFGTVLISTNPNTVQRTFVPEERCWVTGIQVLKDGVLFRLYSDPYNGLRYSGNLKVAYPTKKEVPPVDVALGLIAEVLTVVPSEDQGNQASQPAPLPPQGVGLPMRGRSSQRSSAPAPQDGNYPPPSDAAPAQPPMSDIAPPPPPSDAPPVTIALGQTRDQVIAGFGQPVRIAKIGTKEIFFYKDLKVTFIDGKVTNAE